MQQLALNKLGNSSVKYLFLGSMPNESIHKYYGENEVDLFINTSESEGLPVSIMEAMSYGVPVIAPDVGGISEIVDSYTGFLVSKENCIEESFNAIKIWSSLSEKEKNEKSTKSFEKWRCLFDAESNYKNFSCTLVSLI